MKLGLIRDTELMNILEEPELTNGPSYMRYNKDKLTPFYLQAALAKRL